MKFGVVKGLKHETITVSKEGYVKRCIYHVQHVNNFHKRLGDWMDRFNGVVTKYLANYLYWFKFLQQNKELPTNERVKGMLLDACQKVNYITINYLREVQKSQFKGSITKGQFVH